jgi:hypothetical protein
MARGDKKEEREKAERETRRKLAQAQIRQFPDPVLRSVKVAICCGANVSSRMGETLRDAAKAGLAITIKAACSNVRIRVWLDMACSFSAKALWRRAGGVRCRF